MEKVNTGPHAQGGQAGMPQLLWHITTQYSGIDALSIVLLDRLETIFEP